MITITSDLLAGISEKARSSARKRANYNFHQSADDPLQRLINAVEPGTYVRPHKHENPDKREAFIVLRGKLAALEFDDNGKIKDYIILGEGTSNSGAEIPARAWHTIIALEEGTAVYEVKDGPYIQPLDKNFAVWAPEEGSKEAREFNERILKELKR